VHILGVQEQAHIDAYDATRSGKRIDLRIVYEYDAQNAISQLRVLGQTPELHIGVVLQQRIRGERQRSADLLQETGTNTGLGLERDKR